VVTRWDSLTSEQQCVIASAIGGGDLSSVLLEWNPDVNSSLADSVDRLGRAVTSLIDTGLITAHTNYSGKEAGLTAAEVAPILANQKAWWNGDDGLEEVLWLELTNAGEALWLPLTHEQLYGFKAHGRDTP
jgi:hypothetical protein